jgi:DNA polymerase-3 subunit gamma/tau
LILGPRSFSAEINAACSAFLRNSSAMSVKILFIRALRKLQMRFSPILMEDDPKLVKLSSFLQSLEEGLNEFWVTDTSPIDHAALEKLCGFLVKNALALESEGLSGTIPIGHIRCAAYWCRLAPNGKRKTLLIENAENMREEARNSLLKLLEEPPGTVSIILTSRRREAIIATILSRLRPYRFLKRSAESEKEVIRRVFQDSLDEKKLAAGGSLVSAYLDSFLPSGTEKLYPLAAWFIASLARTAAVSMKKKGTDIPVIITALGERYAPIADSCGFERSVKSAVIIKTLIAESGNFENDSFSRFLKICLDMVNVVLRESGDPSFIAYNDMFKKYISEADTAVGVLNQSVTIALEALFYRLKTSLARGSYD